MEPPVTPKSPETWQRIERTHHQQLARLTLPQLRDKAVAEVPQSLQDALEIPRIAKQELVTAIASATTEKEREDDTHRARVWEESLQTFFEGLYGETTNAAVALAPGSLPPQPSISKHYEQVAIAACSDALWVRVAWMAQVAALEIEKRLAQRCVRTAPKGIEGIYGKRRAGSTTEWKEILIDTECKPALTSSMPMAGRVLAIAMDAAVPHKKQVCVGHATIETQLVEGEHQVTKQFKFICVPEEKNETHGSLTQLPVWQMRTGTNATPATTTMTMIHEQFSMAAFSVVAEIKMMFPNLVPFIAGDATGFVELTRQPSPEEERYLALVTEQSAKLKQAREQAAQAHATGDAKDRDARDAQIVAKMAKHIMK